MPCKIAVLGGGAAGVVAAAELARRGATVDLFERNADLGGLHKSVPVDGDSFDIGAFFFGPGHALISSFPSIESSMVPVRHRPVSITPDGSIDFYPCTPRGYLKSHGVFDSALALSDLAVSRVRHRHPASVPDFAKRYLGGRVYRKSGLQNYIERLYGTRDSEIELESVRPRIQLIALFSRPKRILLQATRNVGKRPYLTYARPREGFPSLYAGIASELGASGVTVRRSCPLTSMKKVSGGFEANWDGTGGFYDRVVSTIPVPLALRLVGESTSGGFEYMNLVSLFYRGRLRSPATVLYNFTFEGMWKRMTVFSHIYGPSQGEDYLTVEVTTADLSEERVAQVREDFERHVAALGLFEAPPRCVGHSLTERAYPACKRGRQTELNRERERLHELGVYAVGRQGSHSYLSSNDVALAARALAREIPL